jgi:hypothetical protein
MRFWPGTAFTVGGSVGSTRPVVHPFILSRHPPTVAWKKIKINTLNQQKLITHSETEFFEIIRTKVFRVFLLAIQSHLYWWNLLHPPFEKKWFETSLDTETSSLRTLKIMPRNLNEVVRSWIRLLVYMSWAAEIWTGTYPRWAYYILLPETWPRIEPVTYLAASRRAGHLFHKK